MAHYELLPIYRAAFNLAVNIKQIVKHTSHYHNYALGSELREPSRGIFQRIIDANESRDRKELLERLRRDFEKFKVLARLCQESSGFTSRRAPIR